MLALMASQSGAATPVISNNPAPFLHHLRSNEEQLQMLQRLQAEQDSRVHDLAHRIRPLSPNGSIPGLALPHFDENNQTWNGLDGEGNQSLFDNANNGLSNEDDLNFYDFLENNDFNLNTWDDAGFELGQEGEVEQPVEASGTPDVKEEEATEDNSLFGDGEDDGEGDGGRVVGSVGTSSEAPSPKVPAEEANDEPKARKRRRTAK